MFPDAATSHRITVQIAIEDVKSIYSLLRSGFDRYESALAAFQVATPDGTGAAFTSRSAAILAHFNRWWHIPLLAEETCEGAIQHIEVCFYTRVRVSPLHDFVTHCSFFFCSMHSFCIPQYMLARDVVNGPCLALCGCGQWTAADRIGRFVLATSLPTDPEGPLTRVVTHWTCSRVAVTAWYNGTVDELPQHLVERVRDRVLSVTLCLDEGASLGCKLAQDELEVEESSASGSSSSQAPLPIVVEEVNVDAPLIVREAVQRGYSLSHVNGERVSSLRNVESDLQVLKQQNGMVQLTFMRTTKLVAEDRAVVVDGADDDPSGGFGDGTGPVDAIDSNWSAAQ